MNGKERRVKVKTNMYYVNNLKSRVCYVCTVLNPLTSNYNSNTSNWTIVNFFWIQFILLELSNNESNC